MLADNPFKESPRRAKTDAPIRVCFMLDCLGTAGIECQILLLLKHLDRSKVQPYLCLLRGHEEQSQQILELDGRPIVRLGVSSLHHPSVLSKAVRFASFLRRERIDVFHPLFHDSLYFGAPVAKLAGVPAVVRFRVDLGYWMKPRDRWLVRILNHLLDATMVNCEACKQFAVEHEWASPDSVAIIPNGVDLTRFRECPQEVCGEQVTLEKRVGIVANLRPVKNLDLLVRAAALLKASHPNVRFQIAGEGESRAELESLIVELGLQERFDLLGAVSDIPAFLRTLDVAVLCSLSEGSPNSIMEYMAAARPIVATAVGGCTELLQNEQFGLLVPPNNVQQLAAAIDRLLQDRELATRLGANARQRAFAEYGVGMQARRYEDFYHQLMQNKKFRTCAKENATQTPDQPGFPR